MSEAILDVVQISEIFRVEMIGGGLGWVGKGFQLVDFGGDSGVEI